MDGYEPEVALAVRIPKSSETAGLVEDHSETQKESNTDVDTNLMSYGFEYIDATGEVPLRRSGDDGSEFPPTDGLHAISFFEIFNFIILFCSTSDIPHLPRVLDALSTIMWPSMRSAPSSSGLDSEPKRECDSILAELLAHDHGSMTSPASHRESEDEDDLMEQMRGLLRGGERKVKDDINMSDFGENDTLKISTAGENIPHAQLPWLVTSSKAGDSIFSPIESISLSHNDTATSPFEIDEDLAAKLTNKFSIGFEDDFTVFVSAPNNQEGETTPDAMSYHRKQRDIVESPMPSATASSTLKPWRVLERYQSLGSVSDFGGSDFGDEGPMYKSLDDSDDDLDDDLPTKTEIMETSAKIFGLAALQKKGAVTEDGDTHGSSFDLSQVMSALQQFKTDISRMDDEEERRKSAARVALGLVYGLEGSD